MSIEFHCLHCNRLLKTDDNRAGQQCECPHCKQILVVPDPEGSSEGEQPEELSGQPYVYDSRKQQQYSIPKNACPQCFTPVETGLTQCPTCGLVLRKVVSGITWQRLNASFVFHRALKTFKEYWAISIGGAILYLFLGMGMTELTGILLRNQANLAGFITIGGLLIQSLLFIGLHILFLNIAKGNQPQLNDLISGGRYIFRYIANQLIFFLLILFGAFFFVIPGIIVALISVPLGYVIVDQKLPGLLSIRRCFEITSGNKWKLCLLALAAIGMLFWGTATLIAIQITLGIVPGENNAINLGFMLSFPLINLLFAVAYCEMTGQ